MASFLSSIFVVGGVGLDEEDDNNDVKSFVRSSSSSIGSLEDNDVLATPFLFLLIPCMLLLLLLS